MWEDWKNAWQQAVDNFDREIAAPEGTVSAMQRDLNAARAALNRLEGDIAQARKDVIGEEEQEAEQGLELHGDPVGATES